MKIITFFLIFFLVSQSQAASCALDGKNLRNLSGDGVYELQLHIQLPFPPKLFDFLEKYFGKFSKKNCENSIEITRIKNTKTLDSYLAFYTYQTQCDGGNSYGIIFKESDPDRVFAIIEDSYIDCQPASLAKNGF